MTDTKPSRPFSKIFARNKRAFFDYEIEERLEAGIVLRGSEVKSIRARRVSIKEAYAQFDENGELWLYNCHIGEWPWANRNNHDPVRPRKLLLHKRELSRLSHAIAAEGMALLPLAIYLTENTGLIKVELGLGKGKKTFDKRETLKRRTAEREIERALRDNLS